MIEFEIKKLISVKSEIGVSCHPPKKKKKRIEKRGFLRVKIYTIGAHNFLHIHIQNDI